MQCSLHVGVIGFLYYLTKSNYYDQSRKVSYRTTELKSYFFYEGSDTLTEEKLTLYGIILSSGDYAGARNYLNNIPSGEDEKLIDFKTVQNINIDRFENEEYEPSAAVLNLLQSVAYKHHTYSAYAKALLYLFTGELIITPLPEYNPQIEGRSKGNVKNLTGEISIYPNPATNQFVVKNVIGENVSLDIHDISGQLLMTLDQIDDEQVVNLSEYNSGVYFIKLHDEENILHYEKLIIID